MVAGGAQGAVATGLKWLSQAHPATAETVGARAAAGVSSLGLAGTCMLTCGLMQRCAVRCGGGGDVGVQILAGCTPAAASAETRPMALAV